MHTVVALVIGLAGACGPTGASPQPSVNPSETASPISAAPTTPSAPASTPRVAPGHGPPIQAVGAQLIGPSQLAFDPSGNLYLAECDWTHAAVHRIDPHGTMTTFAGTGYPGFSGDAGPATSAQLFCVPGLAFAPNGSLYVVDHVNNRIRRIDAAGIITTVVGSGPAGLDLGSYSGDGGPATTATLQEPRDIAFDATGNLYISDRDNNRIRKVDRQGIISTIAGNGKAGYSGDGMLGGQASIWLPLAIVVDVQGNVIFVDSGNSRVRKIDRAGIITTIAGTGESTARGDGGPAMMASLVGPETLILDSAGNLYITQTGSRAFRRVDKKGTITSVVGIGPATVPLDQMPHVTGWVLDEAGNLFVADGKGAVFRIDTGGGITLIAGHR